MSSISNRSYPRSGIHGRIVHDLGEQIGSGGLMPGDRLPADAELTARFQASRTATREALKVLSSKGLIEARQRAGTFVKPREEWDLLDQDVLSWLSPESVGDALLNDLMEMREVIEPVAARFAASRATDEDLARIDDAYQRMEENQQNVQGFYEADKDFHLAVLNGCHNQFINRMSSIVGTILSLTFKMQSEVEVPLDAGLPAHKEVLERIRAGDRRGAEKAMRATIGQGKRKLEERTGHSSRRRR